METFRTYCSIDLYGRLNILSSTQIVFHTRRNVANALHIPKSMIRVIKPRVGGGFGAKQTNVCEVYPAFVTWKTKKPSKIIFSRVESQIASSPRHEMEIHLRLGATKEGIVKGIDMHTLSNTGAYGEHGPTTVGLSGHKSIPLYAKAEAFRFTYDVVYTNHMSAGAYRGYGATQGLFAVESAVNELAAKLHMDPFEIRQRNIVKEGDYMPAYYGATNTSCALDRCLAKVHEMIRWDEKYPVHDLGNGKVRAVGMGMAMQGSGISGMDVGSATLKVNDEASTASSSVQPIWGRAVTPRWHRSQPKCWTVSWMTLPFLVQILTLHHTTLAPMPPVQRMSPARLWKNAPSSSGSRSAAGR